MKRLPFFLFMGLLLLMAAPVFAGCHYVYNYTTGQPYTDADGNYIIRCPDEEGMGYSCLDSFNPELACFGGDAVGAVPNPNDPKYWCIVDLQNCIRNCVNAEQASYSQCASIADPVAQANCYAVAQTTSSGCQNGCYSGVLGSCG